MWFLFGFLTLLIAITSSYLLRQSASWKPDRREQGYEYKCVKIKRRIAAFLFGVSGVQDFNFTIRLESKYDRFFKKLKISNEIQTGDIEFDNLVYILSDNSLLHKKLTQSENFRNAVKKIFQSGLENGYTVNKLECRHGRLWIGCAIKNPVETFHLDGFVAKRLLPHFFCIVKELNQIKTRDHKPWLDPFVFKSLVVLGISSGLAVNAFIQLSRIWFSDFPWLDDLPFVVNFTPLVFHSVLAGIIIILLLIIFTFWWLKNSSRTHIVLIELLAIGLLGEIGTAFCALRDANMEWQQESPEILSVELKSHYSQTKTHRSRTGSRYKSTNYYLLLNDWNCKCDNTYKIEVSYEHYHELSGYQYLDVIQHSGALGYAWVSDIKPSYYSQTR